MRLVKSLLFLFAFPAALPAQRPAAPDSTAPLRLSLDDAVRRALDAGDEVRLAQATLRQARAQVTQAWSTALPDVRVSLTYQRTFASVFEGGGGGPTFDPFEPDTLAPLSDRIRYLEDEYPNAVPRYISALFANLPFGRENTYIWALSVSQTLFQGGKVGAGIRGARAFERAALAQLDETRAGLVYGVKQAYLGALFAGRLLTIAEAAQSQVNEHLRRVELNHQVGSTSDYDLLRAQVESANQEPVVVGARNGYETALLELRRLVNVPAEQPLELTTAVLEHGDSLPEVDTLALGGMEPRRPLQEAAEATAEFRRQAVRVYRGDRYPTLQFSMSYGGQAFPSGTFPGYDDFRKDWTAALSVSVPLFDGGRIRGSVQAAQAELHRAEAQAQQAREQVAIDAAQARSEMQRARSLVSARRQTVAQAARAYQLATVRYDNGIAAAIEVSDARLAMQQAMVNEAQATRDYLLAIAGLELALGRPVPLARPGWRAAGAEGAQ